MKNVIYSKFSNERSEEFNIRTDIIEDEYGKRIVCKTASNENGVKHLDNIYQHYLSFSEMYLDTNIQINKCVKVNNSLEFEYLEGKTLEEELDLLLFNSDIEGFIKLIDKFLTYIKEGIVFSEFKQSDVFVKIFGEYKLSTNIMAGTYNNIDTLFSNIIINNNWNIIDYEWTFDFPIPFNYIIYRTFFYYLNYSKRKELLNKNIYELFGINEEELVIYESMEYNFQRYILGKTIPIRNLSTINLKIRELSNNSGSIGKTGNLHLPIQIFYDYGNGMSEENSYHISLSQINENIVYFTVDIPKDVTAIRIDPTNEDCLIRKLRIYYEPNKQPIQFNSNGTMISGHNILFNTNDPQILLNNIDNTFDKMGVEFHIELIPNYISDIILHYHIENSKVKSESSCQLEAIQIINNEKEELSHQLISVNSEIKSLVSKVNLINEEKEKLIKKVELSERKYEDIANSTCWKLTKPIRTVFNMIARTCK